MSANHSERPMSNVPFAQDVLARKVTRGLLVLQVTAMIVVLLLRGLGYASLALVISLLVLTVLLMALLWLYARYRTLPVIREKRKLEHLRTKFQQDLRAAKQMIETASLERQRLLQAEQEEMNLAGQSSALELNLATASGPEVALPQSNRQLEGIQRKYQALQEKNGALESKARSSKEILEHELFAFLLRLKALRSLSFPRYLGRTLASQGLLAGLLAVLLVLAQVVSLVGALAPLSLP